MVDTSGNVYVVETKLFKSSDKRSVVAQVLDYGAALWNEYDGASDFILSVDQWMSKNGLGSFRDLLKSKSGLDENDGDAFAEIEDQVRSNVAQGAIRFVVLMDRVPEALRAVIAFVNRSSKFSVWAVEMEYYKDGDLEIANPKLFGADISLPPPPVPASSKQLFFEQAGARFSGQDLEAMKRLYEVSERLTDDIGFGRGRTASISPKFFGKSPKSFYTLNADGRLYVNVKWHGRAGDAAVASCDRLLQKLRSAGFEIPARDYPKIPSAVWMPLVTSLTRTIEETFGQEQPPA